jgi:ATP-dependent Lon protease
MKKMKKMKLLKLSGVIIMFITIFTSCESETENLPEGFTINKVKDSKKLSEIKNSFSLKKGLNKSKSSNTEFNFDNVKEIYNAEKDETSYIVSSVDNENINLGVYPTINGDYKLLKVENSLENNIRKIIYKNLDDVVLTEVSINLIDESISVKSNNSENGALAKSQGCGQAVADCVNENYNETGWWGVTGYLITAFNPWFGVAVVASCALYVC